MRVARVVAGIDAAQLGQVVAAAFPLQRLQVSAVMDAEVVKRAQQVLLERIPQPQLGGDPPAEERAHVNAVAALRGGSEPEQFQRLDVLKQSAIGRRLGMMELIDHHDVEMPRLMVESRSAERDWMLAKTWRHRVRSSPSTIARRMWRR